MSGGPAGPLHALREQVADPLRLGGQLPQVRYGEVVARRLGDQFLVLRGPLAQLLQLPVGVVDLVGPADLGGVVLQGPDPPGQGPGGGLQRRGVGGERLGHLGRGHARDDPAVLGPHGREPGQLRRELPDLVGQCHRVVDGVEQTGAVDAGGEDRVGGVLRAPQQRAAAGVEVLGQDEPVGVVDGRPHPAPFPPGLGIGGQPARPGEQEDDDQDREHAGEAGQRQDEDQERGGREHLGRVGSPGGGDVAHPDRPERLGGGTQHGRDRSGEGGIDDQARGAVVRAHAASSRYETRDIAVCFPLFITLSVIGVFRTQDGEIAICGSAYPPLTVRPYIGV
uniref:Serine/threonine protein kinase n=1 Tax=Planobispora rosea TaxID=35762 RepID=B5LT00_PLARO|nr:serine/threonine protein kinase [Planobispora rosea]